MKGIRGFYRLNESLKRLGLREVPCMPVDASKRSVEGILRLAFTMIDPEVFPMPPWAVVQEELDLQEIHHAKHLAEMLREAIESLESFQEKVAYGAGALDAQVELERVVTQAVTILREEDCVTQSDPGKPNAAGT